MVSCDSYIIVIRNLHLEQVSKQKHLWFAALPIANAVKDEFEKYGTMKSVAIESLVRCLVDGLLLIID
jgi:hypothetical protein